MSGAVGGVGHITGQLVRTAGARAVGCTSPAEKNEGLRSRLGCSAAVDRRSQTFADGLKTACPEGVDVYFDNVGGSLPGSVLPVPNKYGRIVCCGVTAQYDFDAPPPTLLTLPCKCLTADFQSRWSETQKILLELEQSGELTFIEDIRYGLDEVPAALIAMLDGANVGQLAVWLTPGPAGRSGPETSARS